MTKEGINKACKWLEENLRTDISEWCRYYLVVSKKHENLDEFIVRFRKAMEE